MVFPPLHYGNDLFDEGGLSGYRQPVRMFSPLRSENLIL